MVSEIIKSLNLPNGYLVHKNHEVYCSGEESHLIGLLNPIDGTDYIAVGNPYDDRMIALDPSQAAFDPSTLTCCVCGAKGVSL